MKILFLSDLHLLTNDLTSFWRSDKIKCAFELSKIPINEADVIAITGDTFESSIYKNDINPIKVLNYLFNKKPVVFCLGNHEFAYTDFQKTINYWKWKQEYANEFFPHVHCLDIVGRVEIDNINFVGNVFWYDFTLNNCRTLMKGEIIDGWLDASIKNFDPIKENELNQKQILKNLSKDKKNILLTHTVPHEELNWFSVNEPTSPFNAYSGCKDFLKRLGGKNVDWALCGHTHKRMTGTYHRINCINLGQDYYWKNCNFIYYMLEV